MAAQPPGHTKMTRHRGALLTAIMTIVCMLLSQFPAGPRIVPVSQARPLYDLSIIGSEDNDTPPIQNAATGRRG